MRKEDFVNIESIDWGEAALTRREKLFCFWYAHPETRRNAAEAARRAGYSKPSAKRIASRLLKKEKVREAVRRAEKCLFDTSITDCYNAILRKTINRVTIDRTSLYRFESVIDGEGGELLKVTPKKPEELTAAQKDLIECVEYSGSCGLPNYRLYPSEKADREIIRLHELMSEAERESGGYDVETVVDVVKDTLQVKARLMRRNREIAESAELREGTGEARAEED